MTEVTLRLFVSSPGDVEDERRRTDLVVERLNAEFAGRVRIQTVRWELSYYSAHETFQKQIPEAADCDLVIAIFRARLGTQLPAAFPPLPSGEPYPSGTAYEVLSAIEARKRGKALPDVYVFRHPKPPSVVLDAPDQAEIETQWRRLKAFFDTWFRSQSGEFLAAFQTYGKIDDFAVQVEDCLRQWLARRGFLAQGTVWDRILLGSPFPGLSPFEADRNPVFFGRDLAVEQATERLREASDRAAPFLLVIGASGSGKSSLLRAGLLPRLLLPGTIPEIDLWRRVIMTPGPDPFLLLATSLLDDDALGAELRAGTFRTRELLARQLAGDPATALAPLRDALARAASLRQEQAGFAAPRPARLVLAIDQAERLFTDAEPGTAAAFATLLATMVREQLAAVIMALRSDAYGPFQANEQLRSLREDGATFDLVPPNATELEQIVTRPVAACDPKLAFERRDGHSLAALLVADAKGGDALPLLQVTLARLATAEAARGDGVLRFADYQGMEAAVTNTANDALAKLDDAARAELPALIAGLVADVSTDPRTGTMVPVVTALDRARFGAASPARENLVAVFVADRLLTAEGDGQTQRVRPVHEALLRIWPEAVDTIRETAALIRVRHTLEPLVREWSEAAEAKKPSYLQLSPALLEGAQQVSARFGRDLSAPMLDFVERASTADVERRDRERAEQERRIRDAENLAAANRRIARRTLGGLAAALVLAVLAGWQWYDARAQRDRAQRSLALATATANGLTFDLAQKFRDATGVPASMVKDILDRAGALQDQLLASGETSPDLRRSRAASLGETSQTLLILGDAPAALKAAKRSREISQALLTLQPANALWQDDLSISQEEIGDVQQAQGDRKAALASYQASLAIRDRLARADPGSADWQRDLSVSHNKVGEVQQAQGDLKAALASYQASLAIRDRLAKADPGNAGRQRDRSVSQDKIGDVQQAQGDLKAALASYQASLAIIDRLAKADPGNALWQNDLSISRSKVGEVQQAQGDLKPALASYQASFAIADRLAKADPGNAGWQRDLSIAEEKIGDVQQVQGDLTAAMASYQASLAIRDRLVKADPGDAGWQRDLSVSQNRVGEVQQAQGDRKAALASYQASLAIRDRLAKADRDNADWQRDLAVSYSKIGVIEADQGEKIDALRAFRQGRAIIARLAKRSPTDATLPNDLAFFDRRIASLGQ